MSYLISKATRSDGHAGSLLTPRIEAQLLTHLVVALGLLKLLDVLTDDEASMAYTSQMIERTFACAIDSNKPGVKIIAAQQHVPRRWASIYLRLRLPKD
ncbi:MAG: hypothetical protein WA669_18415 [Pseudolabrys sp.]